MLLLSASNSAIVAIAHLHGHLVIVKYFIAIARAIESLIVAESRTCLRNWHVIDVKMTFAAT